MAHIEYEYELMFIRIYCLFISDEENWRNKNPPKKTIVKSRRAANSLLNTTSEASKCILSLKNGYLSYGKTSIQTVHTCPFDSVFTVIAALYADFENVRLSIDEIRLNLGDCVSKDFLRMVERMSEDQKSNAVKLNSLLRDRNQILNEIFKGSQRVVELHGLRSIDCATNVNYLIQKVLPTELFSYKWVKQCDQCNEKIISNRCFIDIDFDSYELESIKKLNSSLVTELIRSPKCKCGGSRITIETTFSDFVMIDFQLEYCIKPRSPKIQMYWESDSLCMHALNLLEMTMRILKVVNNQLVIMLLISPDVIFGNDMMI